MLVKVPLMGDPRFYMMLQQQSVWAAIPDGSAVLLHLVAPLNWPVSPDKVLSGEMGPTELIVALHQYAIGDRQGAILPCRMPMADACKIFTLVPFSAAAPDRDVPIGIHAGYIFSYAPAFTNDGQPAGTNIYTSRPFAKIGNVKVRVTETPEEVGARLGVPADQIVDVAETLTVPPNAPAPSTTQ